MKTITFSLPSKSQPFSTRSALTYIAITAVAFAAGVITALKPILLLAIPVIATAYAMVKLVAIYNEVKTLSFDTKDIDLSYQDIIQELDM